MNIELIKKLHEILEPYDYICPRRCYLCEHHETAILLPNEEKLITRQPEMIEYFVRHDDGFYYLDMGTECPYLKIVDDSGDCIIYKERPVDCRIFPFFPRFNVEDNSYELLRSDLYCPISNNNLDNMEHDVKRVLDIVNIHVSKTWKEIYNKLNYQRIRNTFEIKEKTNLTFCCP